MTDEALVELVASVNECDRLRGSLGVADDVAAGVGGNERSQERDDVDDDDEERREESADGVGGAPRPLRPMMIGGAPGFSRWMRRLMRRARA